MDNEILTSKQEFDGVVEQKAPPKLTDNFNVTSDNLAVLRIQVCKTQPSQDLANDCLTIIQSNIANEVKKDNTFTFSAVCFAIIAALFVAFMVKRSFK